MREDSTDGGPLPEAGESVHALRVGRAVMELSLDAVFDTLADQRRRFLIRVLQAQGVMDVEELSVRVHEHERQINGTAPALETVRRSVEQFHLPMLDDYCLLDHDERSGVVRFYGHPVVEEYLEHTAALETFEK